MSYESSASATVATVPKLTSLSGLDIWVQDFQIACQYNGIWDLFTGDEPILPTPRAASYEERVNDAASEAVIKYWQHRQDADLETWEKQRRKIQHAMAFLAECLHPQHRADVQQLNPAQAIKVLRAKHDTEKNKAVKTVQEQMTDLRAKDFSSVIAYLDEVETLNKQMDKSFSGSLYATSSDYDSKTGDLAFKILAGLEHEHLRALRARGYSMEQLMRFSLPQLRNSFP